MDDTLDRIQLICRDVFNDDKLTITVGSSGDNVDGWDSLSHINLIAAVEHEFGVHFALGELAALKNIGEMVALVNKKKGR